MKVELSCGNGTLLLIQIILILLKMFNIVNWSWKIIFIPSFIVLAFIILALVLLLFAIFK